MIFDYKSILVTGGTGSFGKSFIKYILNNSKVKSVRVFSRDELKQFEMAKKFANRKLRFLIGDVRDKDRLKRATDGVDFVIHAAALKQVPACEYNPIEAIKTNITGTQNVIESSLDCNVKKVLLISTDKAVEPLNLYGATKLCAEKLFVQSNSYSGKKTVIFSVVRYGNVIGSRGSVLPIFKEQSKNNLFTITHKDMTRFWITLEQAAKFVAKSLELMKGGEIFVPKIKSLKIVDLADILNPKARKKYTGIRPGEKINEILITESESRRTVEYKDKFLIQPEHNFWKPIKQKRNMSYNYYGSDNNRSWLTKYELKNIINES